MTTFRRLLTNWEHRFHVHVDDDEPVHDAITVELPPYSVQLIVNPSEGKDMEERWQRALQTLAFLRAQPWQVLYAADVFVPFGIITYRSFDDLMRERAIDHQMLLGICTDEQRTRIEELNLADAPEWHRRRVDALCKALDYPNGAPLPHQLPVAPWPARVFED